MNAKIKLLKIFFLFGLFVVESWIYRSASKKTIANIISQFSSKILRILDIKCLYFNTWSSSYPGLIVSNHISYIDILVLAKLNPSLFITSNEVKNSPGIGLLTRLAGCLFVDRRRRDLLAQETKEIENVLREDISVVLFPEGTSSNGEVVLDFHAALYQSAIDAQKSVHNFYIHYSHSAVAYCGDDQFFEHLYRLCQQKPIYANLKYLGENKCASGDDRKTIAKMSHEQIFNSHISRTRRNQIDHRDLESVWQG